MPQGTLEVLLVGAKGLENTDFLCNMDPYVILTCRTQEHKSSVASGAGSEPEWNETFVFTTSEGVSEITLKIMDSDTGSADDFVGHVSIPLEPVFTNGNIPIATYNVVKDEEYCGEIKIGLTFTPTSERSYGGRAEESYGGRGRAEGSYGGRAEESYGGWKESY